LTIFLLQIHNITINPSNARRLFMTRIKVLLAAAGLLTVFLAPAFAADEVVKGQLLGINGQDYYVVDQSGKEFVIRITEQTAIDKGDPRTAVAGDQIEAQVGPDGVATYLKSFAPETPTPVGVAQEREGSRAK
jgi:hypothetical protein